MIDLPGAPANKTISQQFAVSPFEAAFLADRLRNEGAVLYEPESGSIATGNGEVGEGEAGGV
jgi:hypothetical protein